MEQKMRLKKSKKRKIIKFKYLFYFSIICISFTYSFYYTVKSNPKITNKEFINYLINGGSVNNLNEFKLTKLVSSTMNFLLNIDFTKPTSLLDTSILKEGKIISANNTIKLEYEDDYSNMDDLKEISKYIEDPNPIDITKPLIYIYNTHQLENYNNKNLEIYGITPNVLMASYILREKLNKLGIATIVEDTNISDFLMINGWDYSSSYKATRLLILDKKSKYSSLKYFIDIHRDSATKEATLTTINNKSYAKVLFVVGLEHDNYNVNLELANQLNDLINKYYPTLSRGVLKKEGINVDGIYNQDLSEGSFLIEVGGVDNNIEEVFNTIEALSNIIYYYIKGDENE